MDLLKQAGKLYGLEGYDYSAVPAHEGGRNRVFICRKDGRNQYVFRVSVPGDRSEDDCLAETEFVHYLARNGAPVADVIPSVNGRLAEKIETDGKESCVSLFTYAKGILLYENGYRYREGAPLSEYFRNTGKALGTIHRLSKAYRPVHRRADFSDKYNMEYLGRLIPDTYAELKQAISRRLERFRTLPRDGEAYGLIHFDFSDINYHIDMDTGDLTVFDFDNCIYCWYMFDLAHLWTHGVGWYRHIPEPAGRMRGMEEYFNTILEGYRSETDLPEALAEQLPLYIDMVLIENVVDEFEYSAREGGEPDAGDIGDAANCLINDIPYAGFGV